MSESEEFIVIHEVECLEIDEICGRLDTEPFIVIDEDGDPNFFCLVCDGEWNHLPSKGYNDTHIRKVIGRVYFKDLIRLAKQDPRGWRE